jgi:hypothetical protein
VARAFSSDPSDLAARIHPERPVEAVDALLCGCLDANAAPRPGEARGWTVARRLDGLVAIRLAQGAAEERVGLRCPACGAQFEIGVDLDACRTKDLPLAVEFDAGGQVLRARCPTGHDHARWQANQVSRARIAMDLLGATEEPADEVVEALEAALAESDPAREPAFDVTCPACTRMTSHSIDLESHLLHAFATEQREWMCEIAALARAYHWPEAEIARMPAWRRRFYLATADAADAAGAAP